MPDAICHDVKSEVQNFTYGPDFNKCGVVDIVLIQNILQVLIYILIYMLISRLHFNNLKYYYFDLSTRGLKL